MTNINPRCSEIDDSTLQQSQSQIVQAYEGYREHKEPAPREISLNPFDKSLIVKGKCNRKSPSNFDLFAIQYHVVTQGTKQVSD